MSPGPELGCSSASWLGRHERGCQQRSLVSPAPASPLKDRLGRSLKDANAAADIWEILAADQTQAENRSCGEGRAPGSGDPNAWACQGQGRQS